MEVEQQQLSQSLPQSSLYRRELAPDVRRVKPHRPLRTAPQTEHGVCFIAIRQKSRNLFLITALVM